jgi:alpha-glucosidase
MTTWADGPNADRYAEDLQMDTRDISAGETITIEMAPGGGFAARIDAAD